MIPIFRDRVVYPSTRPRHHRPSSPTVLTEPFRPILDPSRPICFVFRPVFYAVPPFLSEAFWPAPARHTLFPEILRPIPHLVYPMLLLFDPSSAPSQHVNGTLSTRPVPSHPIPSHPVPSHNVDRNLSTFPRRQQPMALHCQRQARLLLELLPLRARSGSPRQLLPPSPE